jgi:hypothetical protein
MPSGKHQQPKDEPCNRINIIFSATLCLGHFSKGPDSCKSDFSNHNFSGHMCSPDGSMSTPNPSGARSKDHHWNLNQSCTKTNFRIVLYPNHFGGIGWLMSFILFSYTVKQLGHSFIYDTFSAVENTCVTHKFVSLCVLSRC